MSDKTAEMKVTTTDGKIQFRFTATHVEIILACDRARIPLDEWRHLARVYGRQ